MCDELVDLTFTLTFDVFLSDQSIPSVSLGETNTNNTSDHDHVGSTSREKQLQYVIGQSRACCLAPTAMATVVTAMWVASARAR